MRYLYTFLVYLAMPFVILRMLWRSRRIKGYRARLGERFGNIPVLPKNKPCIWIHAVSVGEVMAAAPLVTALRARFPKYSLVVTTTTPTGSEQVLRQFKNTVKHLYVPYDLIGAVRRFLNRTHPALAVIIETELWPNLLYYSHKRGIPILLANARLSERSCRGYRWINRLTKEMMSKITLVAAQSKKDGERFISLGLNPARLLVTGNVKFDLRLPETLMHEGKLLRETWGARPTLIAASTHDGEENIVLNAFREIRVHYPDVFLILVPRHPDRFEKVAKLCENAGFSVVKRSLRQPPNSTIDILLGDTMGELHLLYTASDIAFVGGSLVPVGGHNLIEPAAVRLPIISGHYLHNFAPISELLKAANAVIIVDNQENLQRAIIELLGDEQKRKSLGERAYQVSTANTGAVEKHMAWISNQLNS